MLGIFVLHLQDRMLISLILDVELNVFSGGTSSQFSVLIFQFLNFVSNLLLVIEHLLECVL